MKPRFAKSRLAFTALALLSNQATAATFTWTGATSNYWTVAGSWNTGTTPAVANTTDVIIGGTTNVGMFFGTLSYTVRSLTFDGTNDANTSFTLQRTGNNGSGSSQLTFASDSGNATLTVAADSTGDKTFNRGGAGVANIVLTSSLDIVHNGSGNLTFGSQINTTGAGGINKSGTGRLLLAGSNTYTGATGISAGTLSLGHATNTLSSSSAVTVDGATAVLSIAGNSDTVGAVSLKNGGSITGSGGTLTGASYAVESGSVSAIFGGTSIALTKSTAGTVTLSGANTYTGATTVSGGKLVVNGNISTSTLTTVAVGATLGGSGIVGKSIINGTLAVGNSPGTMIFTDTLDLNGITEMEIDGTSGAGVTGGYDFINLTGAGAAGVLTYGGAMTLDIGVIFGMGNYSWNLFDMASETGTFASISLADQYLGGSLLDTDLNGVWDLTSGDNTWQFTESTGVLGLTVIPEPDVAMLLGGLGMLTLLRRRRA